MAASRRPKATASRKVAETGRRMVTMRVSDEALARIDRAAAATETSRTEFMVRAAEAAAAEALLDQVAFTLDAASHAAFLAALDAPAKPPKALVALLREPSPWERKRGR